MNRAEILARILIFTAVVAAVGAPLYARSGSSLMHASLPENGGWSPDRLQAGVAEPLHLRLTSDDVVHGFAIGHVDMEPVDILPGKVRDVIITFERPGTYTFYCTRWCGINHWRMRGVIEVAGPDEGPQPAPIPIYAALGIDIDAPHEAAAVPKAVPDAGRGRANAAGTPIDASVDYYRAHSPSEVFTGLGGPARTDSEQWDIVSYVWQIHTDPSALASGAGLYRENCSACHGESGAGDGVFAQRLAMTGEASLNTMAGGHAMSMQTPPDLTDPRRMLGASPALLHGKILRGGMGTGMPMWGSILTEDQIWNLVAYLYSYQFNYEYEFEEIP